MLIDWFTVIAQIINFLILIALLKRFLYGPIIRAMDARETKIASRLDEAEHKVAEAQREAVFYRQQRAELEDQREERLDEARQEADALRNRLIGEVHSEAEENRAKWYEAMKREKDTFMQDMRRLASQRILALARRALADLADTELEQRAIDVFIEHVHDLEEHERASIAETIGRSRKGVVIHSAFEMPPDTREKVAATVRDQVALDVPMRFETSPDVVYGIELIAPGYKTAWSLGSYLDDLEDSLSEALEIEIERQARARM